ncbi:glycosyltransferase family 4 protein [Chromatium okenii]|uniref:glycosyltransferase family 4 protein n=1 Tax=Chromatium okenii TaxID=61644 RepID=UPI001F5B2792|nr:hypothetical protein [Chromatium okenii]
MSLTLALLPLTALLLSAATTRWLILRAAAGWGIFDQPNARSLHSSPIPRTGGVAVLCGGSVPLLAALLLGVDMMTPELLGIGAALVLVASISLLDDVRQVSPVVRLLAHGSAAGLLIFNGLNWSTLELPGLTLALPSLLASGLTLLYVMWMINLYNFMDGLDGFAGGMAVSGFTALALLGGISGDLVFTLIAGSIAAAALGFLTGNFPPARIFLGDIGAASLGLLAAVYRCGASNAVYFHCGQRGWHFRRSSLMQLGRYCTDCGAANGSGKRTVRIIISGWCSLAGVAAPHCCAVTR